jgi:hypothetical protein
MIMRTIRILLAIAFFMPMVACSAQTEKKDVKAGPPDKIEVYYFHFTARCMTCKTVEAQAKQNVETLYPEMVKQGKISFQSVNLDEESSKTLAEKLKVYGQTLLVIKGNTQIILTNEGFMYAVREPEKFKAIMKEKIDPLL